MLLDFDDFEESMQDFASILIRRCLHFLQNFGACCWILKILKSMLNFDGFQEGASKFCMLLGHAAGVSKFRRRCWVLMVLKKMLDFHDFEEDA